MTAFNLLFRKPNTKRTADLFQSNYSTFFDVTAAERVQSPKGFTKIEKRYVDPIVL